VTTLAVLQLQFLDFVSGSLDEAGFAFWTIGMLSLVTGHIAKVDEVEPLRLKERVPKNVSSH
jgi:hypothetical protein